VAVTPDAIITGGYGYSELSPQQNVQIPENNGNLDTLAPSPTPTQNIPPPQVND
jgi:hypothetical protein